MVCTYSQRNYVNWRKLELLEGGRKMEQHSLVLCGKKHLEWKKEEIGRLKEDELLIKTIAGAISIGAELPQYNENDKTETRATYPKETGYESYGEVISVGNCVESFKIGDRVVAFYGHKTLGIVKENKAIPIPRDVPYSFALLTILSCDAAKGVRKLNPKVNSKVLVTGVGTVGLLSVYYLKHALNLSQIDIIEPNEARREIAKTFGATNLYSPNEIKENYYDYGIECSATNSAFTCLQKGVKENGEICILSDGNKEDFYLTPEFYEKELRIVGSSDGLDYKRHASWFLHYVKHTPFVGQLFEHEITHQELIRCFQELSDEKIKPIKVLVKYIN